MKVEATTTNKQDKGSAVANYVSHQKNNSRDDSGFMDNRPETKALKSLQMMIHNSPRMASQRHRTSNIAGGRAQVIKGPGTNVPTGPAESSPFKRLYAPSPISFDLSAGQMRDTIQRVVTNEMLENKLNEDKGYTGTIDGSTPWHEAILVGKDWVGSIESGSITKKYGPPFNYQAVSADGTRQFRPPMIKIQSTMSGKAQANYEGRTGKNSKFTFNAHATVPDIQDYIDKHS